MGLFNKEKKVKYEDLFKGMLAEYTKFIADYNRIGYGEGKVFLTENDKTIIIVMYNAGFSENEELEEEFLKNMRIKHYMIYNRHPMKVIEIPLSFLKISKRVTEEEVETFMSSNEIKRIKKFEYKIEID